MNSVDQRIETLAARASRVSLSLTSKPPIGLVACVLANGRPERDEWMLWCRWSLVSVPIAATLMLACLYWGTSDISSDTWDLAQSFVQSRLLP